MSNKHLIARWVRRFLLEHVVADLNLSRNTQASYRDAIDRKSTRLNSSHLKLSRMPSSA